MVLRNDTPFLLTDKEILNVFPKEDFYVVFGTSHSAGWCDNGVERIMPKEKNWPSRLSKKLGKPVFNLAVGGVTPNIMLEIVSEFAYYYSKQNAKCLGAIIEARATDHSVFIDTGDFIKHGSATNENDLMQSMHHAITLGRDYINQNTIACFYNTNCIARQVNAASYKKYKDITADQAKWLEKTLEYQMLGGYIHFDCLNKVLRMTQILNSHNIPNHVFHWESEKVEAFEKDDTPTLYGLFYKTVNNYAQRGLNFINWQKEKPLSKHSFHMLTEIERRQGIDFLNQNECACQHHNELVSAEAAQILYEEIK